MRDYKIAVAGTGYVGLSIATLCGTTHQLNTFYFIDHNGQKVKIRSYHR